MTETERLKQQDYCRSCGRLSFVPCDDCVNGQCDMNCGPGMVDVRGILKCAIEEYEASNTHKLVTENEARAMRDAIRGMMVRLGLYDSFARHVEASNG